MPGACAVREFGHHFKAAAAAGIRFLLKDWADVRDYHKRGPLHHAAAEGFSDACKYFVEDLKLDIDDKDDFNKTPLIYAAEHKHTSTAKLLVDYGAALECNKGRFPLLYAVENGDIELMKSLLSKGAKVDFSNSDFCSALVHAAMSGHHDASRLLLEHGANPNGHPYSDTFTPLRFAIQARSLPCVKLLVEANATLNGEEHEISYIWTMKNAPLPLHLAAVYGNSEIVKRLLQNGADPNIKRVARFSDEDVWIPRKPIWVAAQYGHVDVVKDLFPCTKPDYEEWSIDSILGHRQPIRKGKKKDRAERMHKGKGRRSH
ncbi:unnamed protein product [Cuscuta epithymum]|uniref:Ankyrin repeat protein n=1 Tax=Cuscuta epithymum TaxID=186058 RepID=A0AAV0DL03_9ASTE|nr:unnamed protein product [Cuscuta epithymum]CAH9140728.1 unnamed protein product [Cuscuta epithymum]